MTKGLVISSTGTKERPKSKNVVNPEKRETQTIKVKLILQFNE